MRSSQGLLAAAAVIAAGFAVYQSIRGGSLIRDLTVALPSMVAILAASLAVHRPRAWWLAATILAGSVALALTPVFAGSGALRRIAVMFLGGLVIFWWLRNRARFVNREAAAAQESGVATGEDDAKRSEPAPR